MTIIHKVVFYFLSSHQCFDAVGWVAGRASAIRPVKTEWWGAGMVICLGRCADLHMAELMPLKLTVSCSSKFRLVLPFWYWLTQVVPDKGPLNMCACVCACVASIINV